MKQNFMSLTTLKYQVQHVHKINYQFVIFDLIVYKRKSNQSSIRSIFIIVKMTSNYDENDDV